MKQPLTRYGLPQVAVYPAVLVAAMVAVGLFASGSICLATEAILALLLLWTLSFFRDPARQSPTDPNLLLAPADGKITDIETIQDPGLAEGPVLRIGIFLSIFNVHINRSPCRGAVESITYRPGAFRNALNPDSSRVNESNTLRLVRRDAPCDPLTVRQISGAIARRIVCRADVGDALGGGEAFGMIKFGSRTEICVPLRDELQCTVKVGEKAVAGETVLAKYQS